MPNHARTDRQRACLPKAQLAILNREPTELDSPADLVIHDEISRALAN